MKKLIRLIIIVQVLFISSAWAETATVTLSDIDIIRFEGTIDSLSVAERAGIVTQRIQKAFKDSNLQPSDLIIKENQQATDIFLKDHLVMTLTDGDAQAKSISRDELVRQTSQLIKKAIDKQLLNNKPHGVLKAIVLLVLTTVLFGICLYAIIVFFPRLQNSMEELLRQKLKPIKIHSIEILKTDRVMQILSAFLSLIKTIIILLLLYVYVPTVLSFFPWTAKFAPKLFDFVLSPLKTIFHALVSFLPNLFLVIVISYLAFVVLRFLKLFFTEIEKGEIHINGFYRDWAIPTYKLVRILIWTFALIIIFPYLPGSGSPAFQGISVFLGILLSLGSSSAIANIIGGVVITYMRPFRIGDRVKIADTEGDIIEKNLLVTRIRTTKNVEISIPNSMILNSHIINYSTISYSTGVILHTTVTIGYDVPWRIVHKLLLSAADRTPEILKSPEPFVLQSGLNDFYVSYELNAYTKEPNKMAMIYSVLHQNIQDAFNAEGVEIMSPHYIATRNGNKSTINNG